METALRMLVFGLLNIAIPYLVRWGIRYTPTMINQQLRNLHVYNFTVGSLTAVFATLMGGFDGEKPMRGIINVF